MKDTNKKTSDNSKELKEVRVPGVPEVIVQELKNIAKNNNIPFIPFMKMKLREIRDSYPEKDREKPIDY